MVAGIILRHPGGDHIITGVGIMGIIMRGAPGDGPIRLATTTITATLGMEDRIHHIDHLELTVMHIIHVTVP